MCHLRGLVHLHLNAAERAKECFMEALSIDVKCYDSFDALVSGNMMDVNEGKSMNMISRRFPMLIQLAPFKNGISFEACTSNSRHRKTPNSLE